MARLNPFTGELIPDDEVTTEDLEAEQNDIINLGFRVAINGDYSQFDMTGKNVDEYADESGIDTAASTNETYDSTNDLYQPASELDSFTKLMLHLNGLDGATTTIDASQSNHTITFENSAELDTAFKKFGTSSCLFNLATSDRLKVDDTTEDWNFGTGDFTLEMWFRSTDLGGSRILMRCSNGLPGTDNWVIVWSPSSGGLMLFNSKISNAYTSDYAWFFTLASGTWYHIAIVRDGTNLYCFKDGVAASIATASTPINGNSVGLTGQPLYLGGYPADVHFSGHMDEVRVSKGIARWTTNFTPPTSEYEGGPPENMTLISEAVSADTPPSTIRLVIREEDVDSITLNTDLLADVSRDDGTTWETITLTVDNQFDANSRILVGSGDVSGQPSGTDLRYRIRTANNKDLKIHGTARLWS